MARTSMEKVPSSGVCIDRQDWIGVRKTFVCALLYSNRSCYQGRLGTSANETLKKTPFPPRRW
jgi:hypothetical protein